MKALWVDVALVENEWTPQTVARQHRIERLSSKHHMTPLGEVCDIQSGQYVNEYVPRDGGDGRRTLPYIRVDNIRPYVANMNTVDLAYVDQSRPVVGRSMIRADDVVIARTGTLGKACLAVGDLVGAVASQHITRLTVKRPARRHISPEMLCAYLNSELGRSQLVAGGAGSTRLELTHERLSAVAVPSLAERRRTKLELHVRRGCESLVRAWDLVRRAIAQYENAFGLLGAICTAGRKWLWLDSGRIESSWVPRYYSGQTDGFLSKVREHFTVEALDDLAHIARGKGTRVAHYSTSGVPFVRTTSLINGGIDPFPDHYASAETYEGFGQGTRSGDVLLSIEGKIGQAALLTDLDSCVFKNHIELIRPHEKSQSIDIYLCLASEIGQMQMRRLTVIQATLPGLANRSRKIVVPLSPKGTQLAENVDRERARAHQLLCDSLELRVQGLRDLREAALLSEELLG